MLTSCYHTAGVPVQTSVLWLICGKPLTEWQCLCWKYLHSVLLCRPGGVSGVEEAVGG